MMNAPLYLIVVLCAYLLASAYAVASLLAPFQTRNRPWIQWGPLAAALFLLGPTIASAAWDGSTAEGLPVVPQVVFYTGWIAGIILTTCLIPALFKTSQSLYVFLGSMGILVVITCLLALVMNLTLQPAGPVLFEGD